MALTWTAIFKPERVRPPHIDDLTAVLTGQAEDVFSATVDLSATDTAIDAAQSTTVDGFETDNDALIATAVSDMEAHIDANSTGETVNQGATALKAAIAAIINAIAPNYATHKTDLAADVTANMPSQADISLVEALARVKSLLNTGISAQYNSGTNYACTRCGADGRYPANNDPDETVSTEKHCVSCDGLGRTKETLTPIATSWAIPNDDITL